MWFRAAFVCLLTLAGCRDRQPSAQVRTSPLETGIARDLTARFATPVTVACTMSGPVPVTCKATLPDGTVLPIALSEASKTEWGWHVDGMVIETAPIVAFVQAELAALKIRETATCGPARQVVKPGGRVACTLSGGGAAFITVAADGQTSLELALDSQAAAARSELVTPERDRELTAKSLVLEGLEGESDGEEEVTGDGGVDP